MSCPAQPPFFRSAEALHTTGGDLLQDNVNRGGLLLLASGEGLHERFSSPRVECVPTVSIVAGSPLAGRARLRGAFQRAVLDHHDGWRG